MRIKTVGNAGDRVLVVVKNAEASATIPRGTPLCLALNGTDDGLAVVLPATNAAVKAQSLFYGVALNSIAPTFSDEAFIFGYVPYALVTRMTRAASTDSWTSSASLPAGMLLGLDTINNAFLSASASLGSGNFIGFAVVVDTFASAAASASATSDTRTAIVTNVRIFVRAM